MELEPEVDPELEVLARIEKGRVGPYSANDPEPEDIRWVWDNGGDVWCRETDGLWACRSQPGVGRRIWEDLLWKYGHLCEMTETEIETFLEKEA